MRITLNLASRPYIELRPLYQRLRMVALLLLVAGAVCWWVLRTAKTSAAEAQARADALTSSIQQARQVRTQAEQAMREPQNAAVLNQAHFLNNLYLHKSFSWTAVMMDLEQVLPAGVQVLNIDPIVGKDGTVTIRMRVAGPREKAVTLVRNLEHSRRFLAPRIVGETAQTQSGPSAVFQPVSAADAVNFDVLADYNPLEPRETAHTEPAAGEEKAGPVHPHRHAAKPAADRSLASARRQP